MKLRIVSDGTILNTSIVNAETGEALDQVTCVSWQLGVGRHLRAHCIIELEGVPLDLTVVDPLLSRGNPPNPLPPVDPDLVQVRR